MTFVISLTFRLTMNIYREAILDHYHQPKNWGRLKNYDLKAKADNPLCGDILTVYLKLDAQKKIKEIKFCGAGCAIAIASASMLSEKLIGQPQSAIKKMSEIDISGLLKIKLSPIRLKCAMLGLLAMKKCVELNANP